MGVTHSTIVMVGINIEDEIVFKHSTKYNEDTGEPYTKSTSCQYRAVCGKLFYRDFDIRHYFNMEVHYDVVGLPVEVIESGSCEEISFDTIIEMKAEVKERFAQKGLDVDPRLYVVHCVY